MTKSKRLLLTTTLIMVLVFSAGMFAYTYITDYRLLNAVPAGEDFAQTSATPTQPNWNSLMPTGPGSVILRPNAIGDEYAIPNQYPLPGYHWDKLDDVTPDEDATYVRVSGGTYRRDLYLLPPIVSDIGIITRVTVYFRIAGSGSNQNGYAKAAIKTYNTVYEGAEYSQDGHNYATYSQQWSINPYTGAAWIRDEVNLLQAGLSLHGQGSNGSYATQLYVQVDYRPRTYGDVPLGNLFQVAISSNFPGDSVVNVYLTNVSSLNKAYEYLNLKLALDGAVESDRLLTLQNGTTSFNLNGPASGLHTLRVAGGSFGLVSGNAAEWRPGWTLVPELFIEVLQK